MPAHECLVTLSVWHGTLGRSSGHNNREATLTGSHGWKKRGNIELLSRPSNLRDFMFQAAVLFEELAVKSKRIQ
ncbi:hypothetical protein BCR33DRAFT_425222 [Rhizoclosmatium globosum]|uniref:Uncharacterized protein n=1 Tax=Rhizoclosmatium globosum TaxID=329046 RepID=A0A1Y2BUW2_9FUNG|nr:hypothetical protein BCR33DRAFT_425222 [Rhizoclosmatium globosum]|eukprot:ORY38550.1 hypothetical protein BCR33DRAFT_425222 [Rhizoclosmatium globosum]